MPNFIIINNFMIKNNKMYRSFRDFKNFNEDQYLQDLSAIQVVHLITGTSINKIYDAFHNEFTQVINKHAPFMTLSNKELKWKKKPWLTKGIQKSIAYKNIVYRKYIRSKDTFMYNKYKYYRDLVKSLTRKSKQMYYKKYFQENVCNYKKYG